MKEAIDTANAIASEHMEIMTANPFDVMTRIKNAGAIFIGAYSCEPLEIILQDQTTYFQQMEQQNSSLH